MDTFFTRSLRRRIQAIAAVLLMLSTLSGAEAAGLMHSGENGPALDIKDHRVNVVIEDGYAVTTVEQVFTNPTTTDLEALYRFPVPDKAAVSEFTVWIDGQPQTGEVFEKEQARQIYKEEKAAGRDAGLTEKNRHYNFEIKVSPVRAQSDTRLRLVYMQQIQVDTGIGRFVYPLEKGDTEDAASLFWTAREQVTGTFSFDLKLRTSANVTGIRLPAHPEAQVSQLNDQEWQVSLSNQANKNETINEETLNETASGSQAALIGSTPAFTLDQDIVVYWRHDENTPASVDLVAHKAEGSNRGSFMLTLTPGDDLSPINEGRDWVFVLDMSGSMSRKHATLSNGIRRALKNLSTADRFRIVTFSDSASEMTQGWQDTSEHTINHWLQQYDRARTAGGTNLYAGTELGLLSLDADRTSAIVLVTDGEANVGTREKKQFLKLMERYDVRLFTAVMGNSANRPLLEAMSRISNGFAVNVSNNDDIVGKLMEFTSKATHQALRDIDLEITGLPISNLTPRIRKTLYRGEQLIVFGHYQGSGAVTVNLKGRLGDERKSYQTGPLPAFAIYRTWLTIWKMTANTVRPLLIWRSTTGWSRTIRRWWCWKSSSTRYAILNGRTRNGAPPKSRPAKHARPRL